MEEEEQLFSIKKLYKILETSNITFKAFRKLTLTFSFGMKVAFKVL